MDPTSNAAKPLQPGREPPPAVVATFEELRETPSDINEHLDLLRSLSSQCEHVTEFGMRGAVSTVALLAGQPSTLISWDINPIAVISQSIANLVAFSGRTSFQPRVGDTTKISIEPTEFLFIDSLHTARQLKKELLEHGEKVSRFIAFHDTKTFGYRGEDGTEPGLRMAIRWFQKDHMFPVWKLVEDRENNNGLVVIERVGW